MTSFVERTIADIRGRVGENKVIPRNFRRR